MKLTLKMHQDLKVLQKKFVPHFVDLKNTYLKLHSKSDPEATRFKAIANQDYKLGNYRYALVMYNKCLTLAGSDEELALLYGNRSAACLEMKKYEECLQNIQLARNHNYPQEKLPRLNDLEQICLELMAAEEKFDVSSFLKLSYEPNPKLPFLIDGLEIRKDENNENGVFAIKALKVGDIICIEEPFSTGELMSFPIFKLECCSVCLKNRLLTLVPCKTCNFSMFCSEECQKYHELNECHNTDFTFDGVPTWMLYPFSVFNKVLSMAGGSLDELEKLFTECQENPKTIFDLDLRDPDDPEYQKNKLRAYFSYHFKKKIKSCIYQGIFLVHPNFKPKRKFIKKLLKWIFGMENSESQNVISDGSRFGSIPIFNLFIRSSCSSNLQQFYPDLKNCYVVTRPISAGEEIFRSSLNFYRFSTEYRQKYYVNLYGKPCTCVACKNPTKYKLLKDLKHVPNELLDSEVKKYENFDFDSATKTELVEMLRKMLEILQSSAADYPNQNYVKAEEILMELLSNMTTK